MHNMTFTGKMIVPEEINPPIVVFPFEGTLDFHQKITHTDTLSGELIARYESIRDIYELESLYTNITMRLHHTYGNSTFPLKGQVLVQLPGNSIQDYIIDYGKASNSEGWAEFIFNGYIENPLKRTS